MILGADSTGVAAIAGAFTSLATFLLAIVTIRQISLQRRALLFRSYIGIEQIFEHERLIKGIPAIRSLECDKYEAFLKLDANVREDIYGAISFLSTIAHLVSEGYLTRDQAWSRYFLTFDLCYHKLLPWYVEGLRKHRYEGEMLAYATFEAMCILAHQVNERGKNNSKLKTRAARIRAANMKKGLEKRQTQYLRPLEPDPLSSLFNSAF